MSFPGRSRSASSPSERQESCPYRHSLEAAATSGRTRRSSKAIPPSWQYKNNWSPSGAPTPFTRVCRRSMHTSMVSSWATISRSNARSSPPTMDRRPLLLLGVRLAKGRQCPAGRRRPAYFLPVGLETQQMPFLEPAAAAQAQAEARRPGRGAHLRRQAKVLREAARTGHSQALVRREFDAPARLPDSRRQAGPLQQQRSARGRADLGRQLGTQRAILVRAQRQDRVGRGFLPGGAALDRPRPPTAASEGARHPAGNRRWYRSAPLTVTQTTAGHLCQESAQSLSHNRRTNRCLMLTEVFGPPPQHAL